uniref:Uncharacterized protein n=1 Tax=Anguilla anguilla TaxID=7936 RepID=A0A0E9UME2_ANGAN
MAFRNAAVSSFMNLYNSSSKVL